MDKLTNAYAPEHTRFSRAWETIEKNSLFTRKVHTERDGSVGTRLDYPGQQLEFLAQMSFFAWDERCKRDIETATEKWAAELSEMELSEMELSETEHTRLWLKQKITQLYHQHADGYKHYFSNALFKDNQYINKCWLSYLNKLQLHALKLFTLIEARSMQRNQSTRVATPILSAFDLAYTTLSAMLINVCLYAGAFLCAKLAFFALGIGVPAVVATVLTLGTSTEEVGIQARASAGLDALSSAFSISLANYTRPSWVKRRYAIRSIKSTHTHPVLF